MNSWNHSDVSFLKEKMKLLHFPVDDNYFSFPNNVDYTLTYQANITSNTSMKVQKSGTKLIKYFEPFQVVGININRNNEGDVLSIHFFNYNYPYLGNINP